MKNGSKVLHITSRIVFSDWFVRLVDSPRVTNQPIETKPSHSERRLVHSNWTLKVVDDNDTYYGTIKQKNTSIICPLNDEI